MSPRSPQAPRSKAKYRLGGSTLALGSAMLSGMAIRHLARPMMQEVADFSQAVVAPGVRRSRPRPVERRA